MNHKKTTTPHDEASAEETPRHSPFSFLCNYFSILPASAYSFRIGAAVTMQSEINLLIFPPASIISRFASGVAQNVIFSAPVGFRPAPGRKPPHFVLFSSVIVVVVFRLIDHVEVRFFFSIDNLDHIADEDLVVAYLTGVEDIIRAVVFVVHLYKSFRLRGNPLLRLFDAIHIGDRNTIGVVTDEEDMIATVAGNDVSSIVSEYEQFCIGLADVIGVVCFFPSVPFHDFPHSVIPIIVSVDVLGELFEGVDF